MDNFLPPPSGVLVVDFHISISDAPPPPNNLNLANDGDIGIFNIQVGDAPPRDPPKPTPTPTNCPK